MEKITAQQLIKYSILHQFLGRGEAPSEIQEVEKAYDELLDEDYKNDYESEFRCQSAVETNIEPPYSRHYESKSKAIEVLGMWVGWTYWYGGGKHGDPCSMPWMEDAYLLNCEETEQTVIVRLFKVVECES